MTQLPTLETTRLRLRPYREDDIAELLPLIGTREVAATTLRIAHPYILVKLGMRHEGCQREHLRKWG